MHKMMMLVTDAGERPDAKYQETIRELVDALELCLECDGLTWEAEREADILVNRYRHYQH
jgi:hypothetical protein